MEPRKPATSFVLRCTGLHCIKKIMFLINFKFKLKSRSINYYSYQFCPIKTT